MTEAAAAPEPQTMAAAGRRVLAPSPDDAGWRALGRVSGAHYDLRGNIAGDQTSFLRAASSQDFAALRGSFLLRITDETSTTYVTDRVASVRGFLHDSNEVPKIRLSPTPELSARRALDVASIGSILVNGYALSGRTLHAGITSLAPGTVTKIEGAEVVTRSYWSYTPSANPAWDRSHARSALKDALIRAVESNVSGPASLSLSAGYDARGILGILRYQLGRTDIECFSYAHGEPSVGSDAYLAAELARTAGYSHAIVESVSSDLLQSIHSNAQLGQGLTNFCDEVFAWTNGVSGDLPVVVGDECMGWTDYDLRSPDDVLRAVYLHGGVALKPLSRLRVAAYEELRAGADDVVNSALAEHPNYANLHDAKDALYFTQRLSRGLMPWREAFAGTGGRQVVNPLIDGDVLDVVAQLSTEDRIDKRLFREVIRELVPEAFTVPFATSMGYSPDWRRLLIAEADRLQSTLQVSSELDSLIPPDAIHRLISRCGTNSSKRREQVRRAGRSLRARHVPMSAVGRLIPWEVDDATLLRRCLVLRMALVR